MIAKDATDYNSNWKCQSCRSEIPWDEVQTISEHFMGTTGTCCRQRLIHLFHFHLEKVLSAAKDSRYDVEVFLNVYEEARKVVHPQNEIICEIAKWLLPILCRDKVKPTSEFPRSQLEFKRNLALEQVRVSETIQPGHNKCKGT